MAFACGAMAEEAQRKLQSALDTSLDGIDKDSLRPIQKRAYLCMSKVSRRIEMRRKGFDA